VAKIVEPAKPIHALRLRLTEGDVSATRCGASLEGKVITLNVQRVTCQACKREIADMKKQERFEL
jgi:hypothetical protein